MTNGNIPTSLIAYLRKPILSDLTQTQVLPVFVVPAQSAAFNKSALEWAKNWRNNSNPATVNFLNTPITNLRWVGTEDRCEGGSTYKVLTPQNWLVDFREDMVGFCLQNNLIEHRITILGDGIYFTAQFVWAAINSQMKLIAVSSPLYIEIMELMQRKQLTPIMKKDLKIGGVYKNSSGKIFVIIDIGKNILIWNLSSYCSNIPTQSELDDLINKFTYLYIPDYFRVVNELKVIELIDTLKVNRVFYSYFNSELKKRKRDHDFYDNLKEFIP